MPFIFRIACASDTLELSGISVSIPTPPDMIEGMERPLNHGWHDREAVEGPYLDDPHMAGPSTAPG